MNQLKHNILPMWKRKHEDGRKYYSGVSQLHPNFNYYAENRIKPIYDCGDEKHR